jgi:hypothetical protein
MQTGFTSVLLSFDGKSGVHESIAFYLITRYIGLSTSRKTCIGKITVTVMCEKLWKPDDMFKIPLVKSVPPLISSLVSPAIEGMSIDLGVKTESMMQRFQRFFWNVWSKISHAFSIGSIPLRLLAEKHERALLAIVY